MLRSLDGIHPQVHPKAFVSEAAYVVGDVEIGEDSSVWPGTVIRGDTGKIRIGKGVNIQDNSVVHSDADAEYGDYVTVGHGVVCHARKVASHVLIGNGAVVNDGVEIGEYSLIAAGAVVLENAKIPANSLVVGIPAQVKDQTLERHHALIKQTAEIYVEKARRYLKNQGLGRS
ncbi:MAG: gamma carbonic anhydrase family protein [Dehalococcoidia bacterium]|nr:gamma carbonic anhydrase family protein [Dehalococcoidia bacterium]